MSSGRLQQTIAHYRQQLLQQEARSVRSLEYAYQHTLSAIQPRLDLLYRQITAYLESGESVPVSILRQRLQLESLSLFLKGQISHYSALALLTTRQLQHFGATQGQKAAMTMLQGTVPANVKWTFGIPSQKAIADLVGATQAGSPLADLFDGFGAEAAQNVTQALINGLTLGDNPRTIAPQVMQALDIPRWRALTIARTEMLRAYRSANLETFRANSDVVKQWRWTAAHDARTCAACLAMDGQLFDLDTDMGTHPNCRCVMAPITNSWSDILGPLGIDTSDLQETSASEADYQNGADWFDQQDASLQRSILGNAKYEAYQNGAFSFADIVGHSDDPKWGASIYERSLKELVGA